MFFHLQSRNYLRLFKPDYGRTAEENLQSRNYLRLFKPGKVHLTMFIYKVEII